MLSSSLVLRDLDALRRLGLTLDVIEQMMNHPPAPGARLMRVAQVQRDALLLHDGVAAQAARCASALHHALSAAGEELAVGDWVLAEAPPAPSPAMWRVTWRARPRRQITRATSAQGRHLRHGAVQRQVLVSNVDLAVLVMGLDHDFQPRRLERYVALAAGADLPLLLVLTKADGASPARLGQALAQARAVVPAGTPLLALDGRDAAAAAQLAPWLGAGVTAVLLGSSGAGKSTLTNSLTGARADAHDDPGDDGGVQLTGAVREDDQRGRHTTTVRSLRFTLAGACLIDTPGLRALRLDLAHEQQLDGAFGDIARWAQGCRFRDCRHGDEPGCAVRAQVAVERIAHWRRLTGEVQRDRLQAQRPQAPSPARRLRRRLPGRTPSAPE